MKFTLVNQLISKLSEPWSKLWVSSIPGGWATILFKIVLQFWITLVDILIVLFKSLHQSRHQKSILSRTQRSFQVCKKHLKSWINLKQINSHPQDNELNLDNNDELMYKTLPPILLWKTILLNLRYSKSEL